MENQLKIFMQRGHLDHLVLLVTTECLDHQGRKDIPAHQVYLVMTDNQDWM